jgi:hypothetical protein
VGSESGEAGSESGEAGSESGEVRSESGDRNIMATLRDCSVTFGTTAREHCKMVVSRLAQPHVNIV